MEIKRLPASAAMLFRLAIAKFKVGLFAVQGNEIALKAIRGGRLLSADGMVIVVQL